MVIDPQRLLQQIAEPVLFLGDGVEPYCQIIENVLGERALFADAAHSTPRASLVAQLGYTRLMDHGEQDDCCTLTPLYVRKSDAEIHWEQRHHSGLSSPALHT
jgi:tRNA threonylcarbamoyladenosine biosynthesis protein TsaB